MIRLIQLLQRKWRRLFLLIWTAVCAVILSPWLTPRDPQAGGDTTVVNRTSRAYEQPAANLSAYWLGQHQLGDGTFEAVFVSAPAPLNPGLGPRFTSNSCANCHIKNGRGLPIKGQRVIRATGEGIPQQLAERAIHGEQPAVVANLTWEELPGQYGDGTLYHLRRPQLALALPNGDSYPEGMLVSLRVPQPVFGVGLLEAIAAETLLSLADPDDRDGDGISGRVNWVEDVITGQLSLGRFGWKANTPHLLQQTAAAYFNDMGISNPLFPDPDGSVDIDQATLKLTTIYVQTLGVPKRTGIRQVQRGERLFAQAQCSACHLPTLKTGSHSIPALANQTIHPYTDLLIHDLGDGLADHRPDGLASGREWRTPPLWGLGLAQTVLPLSGYLHDGRARTLAEAILWHSGEAEAAKEFFRTLPSQDRQALIDFLESL